MKRRAKFLAITSLLALSLAAVGWFVAGDVRGSERPLNVQSGELSSEQLVPVGETSFVFTVAPTTTMLEPTSSRVEPMTFSSEPDSHRVDLAPAVGLLGSSPWVTAVAGIAAAAVGLLLLKLSRRRGLFSGLALLYLVLLLSVTYRPGDRASAQVSAGTRTAWGVAVFGMGFPVLWDRNPVDSVGRIYFARGADNINLLGQLHVEPVNQVTVWVLPSVTSVAKTTTVIVNADKAFYTDVGNNGIGRLDPATNIVTFWPLAAGAAPTAIDFDVSGRAYFVESGLNRIARLNPVTNELTEWSIPNSPGPLGHIKVDGTGEVWFVDGGGNKIFRLNLTNLLTEWPIPVPGSGLSGLEADSVAGRVWFTMFNVNRVGRLNPATNEMVLLSTTPVGGGLGVDKPLDGTLDDQGRFWFNGNIGATARVDTNNVLLVLSPGAGLFSSGLFFDKGLKVIYTTNTNGHELVRFSNLPQ